MSTGHPPGCSRLATSLLISGHHFKWALKVEYQGKVFIVSAEWVDSCSSPRWELGYMTDQAAFQFYPILVIRGGGEGGQLQPYSPSRVKDPNALKRMSKRKFLSEIIYGNAVLPLKVPCHCMALRNVLFLHLSGKDHLEESHCWLLVNCH